VQTLSDIIAVASVSTEVFRSVFYKLPARRPALSRKPAAGLQHLRRPAPDTQAMRQRGCRCRRKARTDDKCGRYKKSDVEDRLGRSSPSWSKLCSF
jgi:hypothetical protein